MATKKEMGGIEYYGVGGASEECQDAVMRLLQFGDQIAQARIISCANTHCLLLTNTIGDLIAVKSGFSSGYGGSGPRRLSYVLSLLHAHGVELDECEVDEFLIERLDRSALTVADLETIQAARPVRPNRWPEYILQDDWERPNDGTLWAHFRPVIPFAIVDSRIVDLAITFWDNPDDKILKGFRRLEDVIRRRTDSDEYGPRLFSQAFAGPDSVLYWKGLDNGEKQGRANLFIGTYMAYRNPRAHKEADSDPNEQLAEFLLLNHLYRLEKEALTRK